MPRRIRRVERTYRCRERLRVVVNLPKDKRRRTREPRPPSIHLALLLSATALLFYLTWLYSDWFARVSSALGLAALVGVMPTLRGFMADSRRANYAKWLDALLFRGSSAKYAYLVIIASMLFVGVGVFYPISVSSEIDSNTSIIAVTLSWNDRADFKVERISTAPRQSTRIGVRRSMFGGPDQVMLSTENLPTLTRSLGGLGWPSFSYPSDFWARPVILVFPAPSVLFALRNRVTRLSIAVKREKVTVESCEVSSHYLGEPVWLGTGGSILPIKDSLVQRWRENADLAGARSGANAGLPYGVSSSSELVVSAPLASKTCLTHLEPKDQVHWTLSVGSSGDEVIGTGELTISGNESYPVELGMELPS